MKNKKMRYAFISVAMIISLIFTLIVPAGALVTDVTTGKEFENNKNLAEITLPEIFSLSWRDEIELISPDGKTALVSEGFNWSLWDIEYNQKLLDVDRAANTTFYLAASFYPDSSKIILSSFDYNNIYYTLIDLNTLKTIKTKTEYRGTYSNDGTILGVTNDGKNIITTGITGYGIINILDSSTLELKSTFEPGFYNAAYFDEKTNQVVLLISENKDGSSTNITVKIYDLSGKMLKTKNTSMEYYVDFHTIIYFEDDYICFESISQDIYFMNIDNVKDTFLYTFYNYVNSEKHFILPLHGDLYLTGDEVINLKTKTVIAKLSTNPEIFKILPDKKQGIGKNGIYDISILLRKVTNIELSIPEYVEVGYSQPLSVTVSFDDNTKKTLKYGEYEITSSNVRTLFIDNDGTVSARNTGTVTLTAEYFGFTVEKKIQVTVLPTKLTAKTVGKTIELSWLKPSATNISGYYVYRTTEKSKYSDTPLHDIPVKSDVLKFVDDQVEPDKQYYYTFKLVFADGTLSPASNEVAAIVATNRILAMQIDNPNMVINENEYVEVDPGRGTVPVIKNNRTLVPIRAIIEAFGGTVEWNGDEREIIMTLGENTVNMWLNSHKALVNGEEKTLDVAPEIFNERTFVPVRFVTENLKLNVEWEATHSLIVISEKPIQNILECNEVKKLLNP